MGNFLDKMHKNYIGDSTMPIVYKICQIEAAMKSFKIMSEKQKKQIEDLTQEALDECHAQVKKAYCDGFSDGCKYMIEKM